MTNCINDKKSTALMPIILTGMHGVLLKITKACLQIYLLSVICNGFPLNQIVNK